MKTELYYLLRDDVGNSKKTGGAVFRLLHKTNPTHNFRGCLSAPSVSVIASSYFIGEDLVTT
jgi:hypothetical protein